MRRILLAFITILIFSPVIFSQSDTNISSFSTTTVIPGQRYEAGWLHEFFFGKHWRDLWTEPVEVPVLDLNKFGGGLKPIRKGGGLQTKTLRLMGENGKEYKFRSVDKDPTKVLERKDPDLKGTIAHDILQDQISSENPFGHSIAYPLMKSVNILQFEPRLFLMPKDPKLGEFSEFGNVLGYLEEVPDDTSVTGSDKELGSIKLLDRLNEKFDEYVEPGEYLKARLIDILINDWDRHKDQWRWIRFKDGDKEVFHPYPIDRDQAFTKFDGIIPGIAEARTPQINHFDHELPDIKYMSWTSRKLDHRFLSFMTRHQWDSVTKSVVNLLTDQVIENAVRVLPEKQYQIASAELLSKLKSRRDQLYEYSHEYYDFVNQIVEIFGTDKDDYVELDIKDNSVDLAMYKRKDDDEKEHTLIRRKVFDTGLTDEIRIFLQDEDDKVLLKGKHNNVDIILVGGDGKDEFENKSDNTILVYDSGKKTRLSGDGFRYIDKHFPDPEDSLEAVYKKIKNTLNEDQQEEYEDKIGNLKYDPLIIDRGYFIDNGPYISYSSDYGSVLGWSVNWTKFAFRTFPFKSQTSFKAAYVPGRQGSDGLWARITGRYNDLIFRKFALDADFLKSGIEVNNFFGFGNETPINEDLYEDKYYRANFSTYKADLLGSFPRESNFQAHAGLEFEHQIYNLEDNRYITLTRPIGTERNYSTLSPRAGFSFDTRDHLSAPLKGVYATIFGETTPKIFEGLAPYQRLTGDLRTYIYIKTFNDASLAFRLRGEKLWGDFPFFDAAFLGGSRLLRGYPSERFAGDASLFGAAELRLKLFRISIIVPEDIWVHLFAENGRVFLEEEESDKWHPSYGGGVYIDIYNRTIILNLTYAISPEKVKNFYINTGFSF